MSLSIRNKFAVLSLSVLSCAGGPRAFAAIPPQKTMVKNLVKPGNILAGNMSVQGGKAGALYSLLDLRRTATKDAKRERIVIDIGDAQMQKLHGGIGYYTVEMKNSRQLTLNFSQAMSSKFSEKQLMAKMKSSPFMSRSLMTFDPVTQTMSMSFDLKKNASAKVVSVRGGKDPTRLVVDLYEARR